MKLQFCDGCIHNGYMYFSAKNFNALFKMELKSGKVYHISSFSDEKLWKEYLHHFLIYTDKKIFFIPYMGEVISGYEFDSNRINSFKIYEDSEINSISHVLLYGDRYILVPRDLINPIAIFSPNDETFHYIKIEIMLDKERACLCDIYCADVVGTNLFIPIYNQNYLIKVDLKTEKYEYIVLDNTNNSALTFYNDEFWIVSKNGKDIQRYTKDFKFIKEYKVSYEKDCRGFETWINLKSKLFLGGCEADRLIVYDEVVDTWKDVDYIKLPRVRKDWAFICGYREINNELYVFPSSIDAMIKISELGICKIEVEYDAKDLLRKINYAKHTYFFRDKKSTNIESSELCLTDYIDYLSR